ncbi:hypothetical protein EB796_007250 [Bugula neritina]|uniref:Uncharacterized protein n=1 Tax=Bugula neritina TaxID=10212 RepID=A0A7J7K728_BUGNE|nr:hypothetical protein EB796_007250 [Bugula neritina]
MALPVLCLVEGEKIVSLSYNVLKDFKVINKPQQLSFGEPNQVRNSNRQKWKYMITWQEPETYDCMHPT